MWILDVVLNWILCEKGQKSPSKCHLRLLVILSFVVEMCRWSVNYYIVPDIYSYIRVIFKQTFHLLLFVVRRWGKGFRNSTLTTRFARFCLLQFMKRVEGSLLLLSVFHAHSTNSSIHCLIKKILTHPPTPLCRIILISLHKRQCQPCDSSGVARSQWSLIVPLELWTYHSDRGP